MHDFSIRITGSAPGLSHEEFAAKLTGYVVGLVGDGCHVAHASLNGRELHVSVAKFDFGERNPDEWLAEVDAKAKATDEKGVATP